MRSYNNVNTPVACDTHNDDPKNRLACFMKYQSVVG